MGFALAAIIIAGVIGTVAVFKDYEGPKPKVAHTHKKHGKHKKSAWAF